MYVHTLRLILIGSIEEKNPKT